MLQTAWKALVSIVFSKR